MQVDQAPLVQSAGRRIVIDFAPSGVVGQLHMQVSYQGIPEGWAFVHKALCDALAQVGQQWAQSVTPLVVQTNGGPH